MSKQEKQEKVKTKKEYPLLGPIALEGREYKFQFDYPDYKFGNVISELEFMAGGGETNRGRMETLLESECNISNDTHKIRIVNQILKRKQNKGERRNIELLFVVGIPKDLVFLIFAFVDIWTLSERGRTTDYYMGAVCCEMLRRKSIFSLESYYRHSGMFQQSTGFVVFANIKVNQQMCGYIKFSCDSDLNLKRDMAMIVIRHKGRGYLSLDGFSEDQASYTLCLCNQKRTIHNVWKELYQLIKDKKFMFISASSLEFGYLFSNFYALNKSKNKEQYGFTKPPKFRPGRVICCPCDVQDSVDQSITTGEELQLRLHNDENDSDESFDQRVNLRLQVGQFTLNRKD